MNTEEVDRDKVLAQLAEQIRCFHMLDALDERQSRIPSMTPAEFIDYKNDARAAYAFIEKLTADTDEV
jgi:hypothetical protein